MDLHDVAVEVLDQLQLRLGELLHEVVEFELAISAEAQQPPQASVGGRLDAARPPTGEIDRHAIRLLVIQRAQNAFAVGHHLSFFLQTGGHRFSGSREEGSRFQVSGYGRGQGRAAVPGVLLLCNRRPVTCNLEPVTCNPQPVTRHRYLGFAVSAAGRCLYHVKYRTTLRTAATASQPTVAVHCRNIRHKGAM